MGGANGLRVLVVDDEPLARGNLTVLLEQDPDIGAITECGSGEDAIAEIRRSRPDLVFLDIQMPEVGGFDVVELLGADLPVVIFVTAYDQYALQAFEAGALDYLLKPFDDARFRRALARGKTRAAQSGPRALDQLVVKDRGRTLFINVADIDWIEAANYYACLHVGAETYVVRRTLALLGGDLGTDRFVRIHRSSLVNVARIRGLELDPDGEYSVELKTGTRLRLRRGFRKALLERMAGADAACRAPPPVA